MTKEKIAEAMRGMEFFQELDSRHLEQLADISQLMEFRSRATIFREDELANDVYFVLKGKVSLVICAPDVGCRQLMEVGPGELIGWSPLVGRLRLSDTAHTVTPTSVIAIKGDRLLGFCVECPEFGYEFMRRVAQELAKRLAATRRQMLRMTGLALPEVQIESD